MKKGYIVGLIILIICSVSLGMYLLLTKDNSESIKNNESIVYYTYEGNGKFVMSSIADKVSNYRELNNNYFIKENIQKVESSEKIIEVIYAQFGEKDIIYGYYTEEEFNKYFKDKINEGLVCDGNSSYNMGEGVTLKCITHNSGFKYDKKDSELCANIDNNIVCIKPNDWNNIKDYKNKFESVGWNCQYIDQTTGAWNDNVIPEIGNLECSKIKPSDRQNTYNHDLFCFIGNDGSAICNDNNGWCGIGSDINTWCFGVN